MANCSKARLRRWSGDISSARPRCVGEVDQRRMRLSLLDRYSPGECANYVAACGYDAD